MGPEFLSLLMFLVTCGVLLLGFPVAFSLAGTALIFAGIGTLFGVFDLPLLGGLGSRYFGVMVNQVLVAVPLFVFMGVMLERSKVAAQLLETMGLLFGSVRGGLGLSVIFVGMLLAASTGIVGAAVVTMGLLSLPTMMKAGYDPKLACGIICASGTLGQIIPPSIVLVLLASILQGANTKAQLALGNFAPKPVSVVDLFAGAFIPGLLLVVLYMAWVLFVAATRPDACPAIRDAGEHGALGPRVLRVLVPPIILMLAVLGSIIVGAATPTEAAAVGSVGALLLAGQRLDERRALPIYLAGACLGMIVLLSTFFDLRVQKANLPLDDLLALIAVAGCCGGLVWGMSVSLIRVHRTRILHDVMQSTLKISSMVFVILLGASMFSLVFRGFGGDELVGAFLQDLPGGVFGAMVVVMVVMFLLGFFLDFIEIMFVVVPIVGPILLTMGLDPIWLGVMIGINLQTSFLTPPFGFALFYLRGVAPAAIKTTDIYRGIVPFVVIQLLALGVVAMFPGFATWLPKALFG